MFNLSNKKIIVTGANGLLGRKHSEAIAEFGGIPIMIDINIESLDIFSKHIKKSYSIDCEYYEVDITQESQVRENVSLIEEKHQYIDGLVNNAANNPKVESNSEKNFSRLENFPLEQWKLDIDVGLTGSFLCSKHYGRLMVKNPSGGSIVNIASDLALMAPDQRLYEKEGVAKNQQNVKPVTYSVVKSGLIGLTRYLSTYWNDENIRCNAMCPGGVENNQPEEFLDRVSSKIPMARLASPNEYKGTLIWMLSDASSYLNGAIIPIDGGRSAW